MIPASKTKTGSSPGSRDSEIQFYLDLKLCRWMSNPRRFEAQYSSRLQDQAVHNKQYSSKEAAWHRADLYPDENLSENLKFCKPHDSSAHPASGDISLVMLNAC